MTAKREKLCFLATGTVGACALLYGISKPSNSLFVVGLALIAAGYWFLRRRLKAATGAGPSGGPGAPSDAQNVR